MVLYYRNLKEGRVKMAGILVIGVGAIVLVLGIIGLVFAISSKEKDE